MRRLVSVISAMVLVVIIAGCGNTGADNATNTSSIGIDSKFYTVLADDASLTSGKVIYEQNCSVCHGKDGGGVVGPNFTDEYWIHGNAFQDLFPIVLNGVYEKGMIAYKNKFDSKQIQDALSYIFAMQGTAPSNPKAPEGKKF
jgi:cytochrome c oxidase cbb3-type subunit 3